MAGAPLVLGLVAVVAVGGGGAVVAGTALVESQRLAGAADAAALAGGDALLGWLAEPPCAVASRVAAANRTHLAACRVEGLEIVVAVSGTAAGLPVERSSRAGPPPS